MKELVALQVKIFSILHSLKQEHLINEAQSYSFKEKTLNLDSSVIYVIGEYEENEDEEQLRKNILDLIKPTVESVYPSGGDADFFVDIGSTDESSPLGTRLMDIKKKRVGGAGMGSLSSMLKPAF